MEKELLFVKTTIDKLMEGAEAGIDPRKRCHSFLSVLESPLKEEALAYCSELTEGGEFESVIRKQFTQLDEDIVNDIKNQTNQQLANGSESSSPTPAPQGGEQGQQEQQPQSGGNPDAELNGFIQWVAKLNPDDASKFGMDDNDHALENAYQQYVASMNQTTQNPNDAQNNVNPAQGSNQGPTTSTTEANPISTNGSAERIMTR